MLLIDIGNSRIKTGVAGAGGLREFTPVAWRERPLAEVWSAVLGALPRQARVLVSNVGGPEVAAALQAWLAAHWSCAPVLARVAQDFAGMHTRYEDPSRLGVDRWLAALAGYHRTRGAVCVVDAGTALTIDVVDAAGEHRGGLIAPGLALMARSLTERTAHLRIDALQPVTAIATNTIAAISLGCREAVAGLLRQFAERAERELGTAPAWWVTGGEGPVLCELSTLPLQPAPELVLQGLALYGEHCA